EEERVLVLLELAADLGCGRAAEPHQEGAEERPRREVERPRRPLAAQARELAACRLPEAGQVDDRERQGARGIDDLAGVALDLDEAGAERRLAQARDEAHGEERMASQGEEVVARADAAPAAQDLLPDPGDRLLDGIERPVERRLADRRAEAGAVRRRRLGGGQRPPVDLAAR